MFKPAEPPLRPKVARDLAARRAHTARKLRQCASAKKSDEWALAEYEAAGNTRKVRQIRAGIASTELAEREFREDARRLALEAAVEAPVAVPRTIAPRRGHVGPRQSRPRARRTRAASRDGPGGDDPHPDGPPHRRRLTSLSYRSEKSPAEAGPFPFPTVPNDAGRWRTARGKESRMPGTHNTNATALGRGTMSATCTRCGTPIRVGRGQVTHTADTTTWLWRCGCGRTRTLRRVK